MRTISQADFSHAAIEEILVFYVVCKHTESITFLLNKDSTKDESKKRT